MSNPITNNSNVGASLVANIAPLLLLGGEKHVKAYFKTMHKPSHLLLFAASPIGLVTVVITLIRLGGAPALKGMIGRQFEPFEQVLLDVTSVSDGDVGLELIGEDLERSVNPNPDNAAMFWIHGQKSGTASEVMEWREKVVDFLGLFDYSRAQNMQHYCYEPRAGVAMASAFCGNGPSAVLVARRSAEECWEKARQEVRLGGVFLRSSGLRHGTVTPNPEDTTCEGAGFAVGHWTDVSPVLTASENRKSWVFDAMCYAFILSSLCCSVGIVVAVGMTGDALTTGLVGGGLLVTSVGSWLTALLVDAASEETSWDVSCFGGTAAGFASREDPSGVQLPRCPKSVVVSRRMAAERRYKVLNVYLTPLVVVLMVAGFCVLDLALQVPPWWAALSMLGVAAITSCARSLLDPSDALESSVNSPGIPYLCSGIKYNGARRHKPPSALNLPTERWLAEHEDPVTAGVDGASTAIATTSCRFPSNAAEPFILSDSYEVLVPDVLVLNQPGQHQPPSRVSAELGQFLVWALQLAHGMRARSIAPSEVAPPGRGNSHSHSQTQPPVLLYSDVLVPGLVLRQPMEVLVSPGEGSAPGLMLERICVAVFGVANRSFRLPGCEMGNTTLGSGSPLYLPEPRNYRIINGKTLQTLVWDRGSFGDFTPDPYNPLAWVAAKIFYVAMLDVAEGTMMEMGRQWFGFEGFRVLEQVEIDSILDSMQNLGLLQLHAISDGTQ